MPLIKTGADNLPEMDMPLASNLLVSPDYLSTLGISLRTGRFFKDAESPRVALVSETAARRLWPGQNPIGQQFHNWRNDDRTHWFTVIGVVGNVRSTSLEYESLPTVYVPYWQPSWSGGDNDNFLVLYVRTRLPNIVDTVRKQVRKIGPHVGVKDYGNLTDVLLNSVSECRFQAIVVMAFGVVALALACIGVYSVASYSIAQRQKEIGIRMALGASGRNIVSMVFRLGVAPVLGGIGAGLIAAIALSRLISSMLFEVQPVDPGTFTAVPVVLGLFAALACYLPAKRGAATDPAIALRAD
jgi:putative ABC transport system permease protein